MRISVEQEYEKTIRDIADGLFFNNNKAGKLYLQLSTEDQLKVDNKLLYKQLAYEALKKRHALRIRDVPAVVILLLAIICFFLIWLYL